MEHTKSNSIVHVPFSWETIPGVPKLMVLPIRAMAHGLTGSQCEVQRKMALPLPPGSSRKPSASKRTLGSEEDPFLAAMIKCTKDCDKEETKKVVGTRVSSRVGRSKSFLLSCKHSFDVVEGHLLTRPSISSVARREQVGRLKLT